LRSKEEAHDYRYFPEPDLPVVRIDQAMIDEEQAKVGELPRARRKRFVAELGLNENQALTLTQHPATTRFFDAVLEGFDDPVKVANAITTDVLRGARFHGLKGEFSVTPQQVAELLGLIQKGDISGKQAKEVFAAMEESGDMPAKIVSERGLKVVANVDELEPMLKALIEKHPKQVESIRAGKKGVMGFFVGQVMKATGGSADPKIVNRLLTTLIESGEEN
jgi:aspartyl-tRNA(Asn)/glutamyl-tRNA(Gln) amidotransferase subunit B